MSQNAPGEIASRWMTHDAERQGILDTVRVCARLTVPSKLPPQDQLADQELPQNFQDTGASGIENLAGQMLLGLFPPDQPFVIIEPAAEVMYNPQIPDETKRQMVAALQLYEIVFMAAMESGTIGDRRRRRRVRFRSSQRSLLESLLITGDTLERMTDDFQFIGIRRDKYITQRDTCGNVLFHTIKETVDALSIDDAEQHLTAAGCWDELKDKPPPQRMIDLYTDVEWQPFSRKWGIRQEINGHILDNESEEDVSAWISTPYDLSDGEHYGRGFIERRLGSLRSLDFLHEKLLDWAALASYMLTCIDPASEFREKDLKKPSGSVSRGARVNNGQIQDVAFLKTDKLQDFTIVDKTIERIERRLNRSMLNEVDMQPQQERVTATQIDRIRVAVMGATSGVYAAISDDKQLPMVDRGIHVLTTKTLPGESRPRLGPLPDGSVEIRTLTGITALGRQAKAGNIEGFIATVGQLLPDMIKRLDENVVLETLARYKNVTEPGIIKSREQWAEEVRAAMRQQIAMVAGEKAVETGGNIIENAAAAAQPKS